MALAKIFMQRVSEKRIFLSHFNRIRNDVNAGKELFKKPGFMNQLKAASS
jgi:hypothetical protein